MREYCSLCKVAVKYSDTEPASIKNISKSLTVFFKIAEAYVLRHYYENKNKVRTLNYRQTFT